MKENHYLRNPETNDTNTSSSIKNKMWRKAWWFITITSTRVNLPEGGLAKVL